MGLFDRVIRAGKRTERASIGIERRSVSKAERQAMYEEQNGRCGICGQPMDLDDTDVDHKIPISRSGGTDFQFNKRLTHSSCNRSRGNRIRLNTD